MIQISYFIQAINGGWGPWRNKGPCTKSCGKGIQLQVRSCDNPLPQNGGLPCRGEAIQQVSCHLSMRATGMSVEFSSTMESHTFDLSQPL